MNRAVSLFRFALAVSSYDLLSDDNNDGVYEINGVTARNYEKNDSRIRAYGKMRLAY